MTNLSKQHLTEAYVAETGNEPNPEWTAKQLDAALTEIETQKEKELEERTRIAKEMTATLNKHKPKYVVSKTAAGKRSMNNGDELAQAMSKLDHTQVAAVAQILLNCEPLWVGDGSGKYDHLNNGQIRMNSGNRIRAAVKRGDISQEDAIAVVNGDAETTTRIKEMWANAE